MLTIISTLVTGRIHVSNFLIVYVFRLRDITVGPASGVKPSTVVRANILTGEVQRDRLGSFVAVAAHGYDVAITHTQLPTALKLMLRHLPTAPSTLHPIYRYTVRELNKL